jgi:hypothetical protein
MNGMTIDIHGVQLHFPRVMFSKLDMPMKRAAHAGAAWRVACLAIVVAKLPPSGGVRE